MPEPLPENIFLTGLDTLGGDWAFKNEPGYYVHRGRVFIQGAIDIAAHNELTDGEVKGYEGAPPPEVEGSPPDEEGFGEGGTTEDVPAVTASGVILHIPAALGPASPRTILLCTDHFHTTPGFESEAIVTSLVEDAKGDWQWILPATQIPPGQAGEMRLILSCFWDTPEVNHPDAGPRHTIEPLLAFFANINGTIARRGSRVSLGGRVHCVAEPDQTKSNGEADPEILGMEFLASEPKSGPDSPLRKTTPFDPEPSPELDDRIGYTVGRADQGRAIILIDTRQYFEEFS